MMMVREDQTRQGGGQRRGGVMERGYRGWMYPVVGDQFLAIRKKHFSSCSWFVNVILPFIIIDHALQL